MVVNKEKLKGGENQMTGEIMLQGFKCQRCTHTWMPRRNEVGEYDRPRVCPKCKSAWWDVLKSEKTENVKSD